MASRRRNRGFTLIELLTVVAIIAILAGLTAAFLPGALERARIASAESNFRNISQALSAYLAEHGSYPPGYGYGRFGQPLTDPTNEASWWLEPWRSIIGVYNADWTIDPFSNGYDTNGNNQIDLMEFLPVNVNLLDEDDTNDDIIELPSQLYLGPGSLGLQDDYLLDEDERPVLYIPVNRDDVARYRRWANDRSASDFVDRQFAQAWDNNSRLLRGLVFDERDPSGDTPHVPPRYDGYVLISVGPLENDFGVLKNQLPAGLNAPNGYYILGLLTYFLATRDANDNRSFDFDYRARRSEDRGTGAYTGVPQPNQMALTPDGTGGQGPLIFKSPD